MPDHLHLVGPAGSTPTLRRTLAAFAVRYGTRFDIHAPEPANSLAIARGMVRYGFFAPVRANLTDDPFAWPWSTLRDLAGASEPAWTHAHRIADALALPPQDALLSLATRRGTTYPPPRPAPLTSASLEDIRAAVRSALRLPSTATTKTERRLTMQAALKVGTSSISDVAIALGCTPASVHEDLSAPHPALDAVFLCLANPHVLAGPLDPSYDRTG